MQSAVVDPNRRLLLDMNFTNNSRTVHPRTGDAARKWTLKWMVWLQDALLTWGSSHERAARLACRTAPSCARAVARAAPVVPDVSHHLPSSTALHDAVSTHLGSSLSRCRCERHELRLDAGVPRPGRRNRTLTAPDVIGFAAVVDNASAFADTSQRPAFIVVASVFFVAFLWMLTPGILLQTRRQSSNRRRRICRYVRGPSAGRILRLNIVSMFFYGTLVGTFHQWLFDDVLMR